MDPVTPVGMDAETPARTQDAGVSVATNVVHDSPPHYHLTSAMPRVLPPMPTSHRPRKTISVLSLKLSSGAVTSRTSERSKRWCFIMDDWTCRSRPTNADPCPILTRSYPSLFTIAICVFMLLIFVLTDASSITSSSDLVLNCSL